jgi:hypothetical protein
LRIVETIRFAVLRIVETIRSPTHEEWDTFSASGALNYIPAIRGWKTVKPDPLGLAVLPFSRCFSGEYKA